MNDIHNGAGFDLYVSIWATVLQDLYKIFDDYEGRHEELYGFSGAVAIPTLATAALLYVTLFFLRCHVDNSPLGAY